MSTFTVDSSLQIRAEVPPDARSGVVRVATPEGTAVWDDRFTVVRDIPLASADFDGDGRTDHAVWNPDVESLAGLGGGFYEPENELDELIERRVTFLTEYQNAAYGSR